MHRCLELAKEGCGNVAPNPLVGAVLVHEGRIIGEGAHLNYGGPHAEVNCINSVKPDDKELISRSVLYVSLEPCAHHGKTPPCADRIIEEKIPQVIIGCSDPFKEVNGKGIEKLRNAGVKVETGILENECKEVNKRFFTFYIQHRPYIVLKWAQTADGIMAHEDLSRLHISNEFTNIVVHRWRSEEASVLVGTNTAFFDDPALTTRLWKGKNPLRLVIDMGLRLPSSLKLFDGTVSTIVFNTLKHAEAGKPLYYQVTKDVSLVHQVVNALYHMKIQSVLVEGGAKLLQSFIDEGYWDEARVITNTGLTITSGLQSPQLQNHITVKEEQLFSDHIIYYKNSCL